MRWEEHCKQIPLACLGVCSQCFNHTGFAPAHSGCVCCHGVHLSGSRWLCRELSEAGPGCMHFPGLSHSGSGFQVLCKGAESVGSAFCALPRSEQLRCPGAWQAQSPPGGVCVLLLPLSQPLGFLGVQWVCLLRCVMCFFWGTDLWLQSSQQMSTVQNPKKSWLTMKPACSLVEDAPLGLQLSPSGSGCPRLPVSSQGWATPQLANSAQSFVL